MRKSWRVMRQYCEKSWHSILSILCYKSCFGWLLSINQIQVYIVKNRWNRKSFFFNVNVRNEDRRPDREKNIYSLVYSGLANWFWKFVCVFSMAFSSISNPHQNRWPAATNITFSRCMLATTPIRPGHPPVSSSVENANDAPPPPLWSQLQVISRRFTKTPDI